MVKLILGIFRSCRKNNVSSKPEHHPPPCQRHNVITNDFPCTTTSPPPFKSSSVRSHICSAFRCGSRSPEYLQKRVVTKVCDVDTPRSKIYSSDNNQGFRIPLLTVAPPCHKKKNRINEKCAYSNQFSTGYTVDDIGKYEEQLEFQVSSYKSFSAERVRSIYEDIEGDEVSPEWGSPARLSVFKKLMPCKVEGKVRDSFAVVKRSNNAYEDFKKSMMEMIVENQMYEESDLKQLLQCFLSLNARYHHGMIMEAFSEIWRTMFVNL